jgi:hypothetical protein
MSAATENTAPIAPYKGVKGWLLLFCVSITILDPIAAVVNLFIVADLTKPLFEKSPALLRLVSVSGTFTIGLTVFGIYTGLSMWKVLPGAVKMGRMYLLSVFYYSIFAIYLPSLMGITGDSLKELRDASLINNIRTIIYIAVWYIYLKRSKRVKATYGENP